MRGISITPGPAEETQQGLLIDRGGSIVFAGCNPLRRTPAHPPQNRASLVESIGLRYSPQRRRTDGGLVVDPRLAAIATGLLIAGEALDRSEAEIGHLGGGLRLLRLAFQAFP